MTRRYPKEVKEFIAAHASEGTIQQMTDRVNERFEIGVTLSQMKAYFHNHHLKTMPMKGRKHPDKKITTPEMEQFILEHYKGTGHQAMADMVNARFGTSFTAEQMKGYYARNKLNSGLTGHFQKGQESWTKGKTWAEFMSPQGAENSRKTQYKKGNIPHNGGNPIGTMVIRRDHKTRGGRPYYWVKVAEPGVWRPKHRVEWEKHFGKIPPGYVLSFADQNTLNWHVDNLVLTTRRQHVVKNHCGLHGYDRESEMVCNSIADLKSAMYQAKRKRKKEEENGNT